MKRAKHLAIFTLLGFNLQALGEGWMLDAWTNTRMPVIVTNFWGIHTNEVQTTVTLSVTNTITNSYWYSISANSDVFARGSSNITLYAGAKEIKSLESAYAVQERLEALDRSGASLPGSATRYYRSERQNLIWIKFYLDYAISVVPSAINGHFVDPDLSDSGLYYTNPPSMTSTGLLASLSLPTNYLSYTPYRDLSGFGTGQRNLVETTWVMTTTNAGEDTIEAWDAWGNQQNITGTNGQVITSTATNGNIEPGFTHLDYGWQPITALMSRVRWAIYNCTPGTVSGESNLFYIGNSTNITWAAAKSDAEDNPSLVWDKYEYTDTAGSYTEGRYISTNPLYVAKFQNWKWRIRTDYKRSVHMWTNSLMKFTMDGYVTANQGGFDHFSPYDLPFVTQTAVFTRVSVSGITSQNMGFAQTPTIFGETAPGDPWCDEPNPVVVTITNRGYGIAYGDFHAVFKYDVEGGFKYY